ncbi:hypothetical protein C7S18_23125 [Ahniella affigens]|uniref:Methyltransferase FkbM domain-containing protein n=1 Tax=Ahniella affigens TaxID=2021234 RepID=A0A2P1PYH1_9GAMM|nr:FkbM family methyltransferase [Ahniella affigens]AVP99892.1 hypothetical protein C7S18_23125 [Ahniella affigens]
MNTDILLRRLLLKIRPAWLAAHVKHLLCVKRRVIETRQGHFLVDPVSHVGGDLIEFGHYEPEMQATIERFLPEGGVFADAGANEGYFSVLAAKRARLVLAFEPQSRLQHVLQKNFELNQVQPRIVLMHLALGAETGSIEMRLTPDLNTGASGFSNVTRYRLPVETVPMRTLTDVVNEAGVDQIDLLKVDIEGAEHQLLRGAEALLAAGRIRRIALELHERQLQALGASSEAVLALLTQHGYRPVPDAPTLVLEATHARQ